MNKSANPSIRGMCLNLSWKECFGFTRILCACVCVVVCDYEGKVCLSVWMHECAVKLCMNRWNDPRLVYSTFYKTLSIRKRNLIFHAAADDVVSLTLCISDIVMKDGLCEKENICAKNDAYFQPCYSSGRICVYHDRVFLCLLTSLCLCVACVARKKKRGRFPLKKRREGDINLQDSRWDVTENGGLKGRQACSSGEKRKHQSRNPRRMCSGSCWMLKTRPGSVCVWCPAVCGCISASASSSSGQIRLFCGFRVKI